MKRNSLICKLFSLLMILSFVVFAAPAQDNTEAAVSPATETVQNEKPAKSKTSKPKKVKETKEEKKARLEAEKAQKAAEKAQKKAEKGAPKDSSKDSAKTASVKSSKSINETFGKIRLRVNAKYGSFTMGIVNASEKTVNVLSTANEFTTNGFYLKAGKKIISLNTDNSVKASTEKTKNGAAIKYDVANLADVLVAFDFLSTEKDSPADMVKITATVTNKSKKNDEFTLKAILDTVLGESGSYHFITSDGIPVKNEVAYRTLQYQKYFLSINDSAGMQIFFTGADCTEPDFVGLANYATVTKTGWEPAMTVVRAFDTVFSYNNSAVCSIWKPVMLPPEKSFKVVFYIALAADGLKPAGDKVIKGTKRPAEAEDAVKIIKPADSAEQVESVETVEPVEPAQPAEQYYVPAAKPVTKAAPKAAETQDPAAEALPAHEAEPVKTFTPKPKNITDEKLSPEYIQALLNRIAELEEDSPALNRQELQELNAELDSILTYLRQ